MVIIIRGAGEIASGIALRLWRCGLKIIMTDLNSTENRQILSFSDGRTLIEDAQVLKADTAEEAMQIIHSGKIAFLSGLTRDLFSDIRPDVLVNCMNAGKEPDTRKEEVPVVIGAGPGYTAGVDCDAVIETKTGYDLGRVIYRGSSSDDSAAGSQGFADDKEQTAGKVSYKANAIAGGVLEAILFFTEELGRNK